MSLAKTTSGSGVMRSTKYTRKTASFTSPAVVSFEGATRSTASPVELGPLILTFGIRQLASLRSWVTSDVVGAQGVDKRDYHKPEKPFRGTTVQQHNGTGELVPMPAKASWLLHIPEIVSQLEAFDVPVLDRSLVEHLFGLRRRRAIELLHRFGGYQAGRTFLIDRRLLLEHLKRLVEGEEFQSECRRKERLVDTVGQLRRNLVAAHVKIPVHKDAPALDGVVLADGIALDPGHLHIAFQGTEDLLAKLYALSQAAARDFDRFRASTEPAAQRIA